MKNFVKILGVCFLVGTLLSGALFSQSLEERLKSLAETNGEMYINPFATAFGSSLNSGWFHAAKPHKLLGFDIGMKAMAVMFPEDQKNFTLDLSELTFGGIWVAEGVEYSVTLDPNEIYLDREAPTIFGDSEEKLIEPISQSDIEDLIRTKLTEQGAPSQIVNSADVSNFAAGFPTFKLAGTGLEVLPMIIPQVAIGLSIPMTPIKAEIIARGLPEIELPEDMGKFNFFGGGAKLALDPFIPIPMFPIDVSAGAYFTQMKVGEFLSSNNTLLTLLVGKELNLMVASLGVYGGFGIESSNISLEYTYTDPFGNENPLEYKLKGDNKTRITLGGRLRLAIINIHADYTMGADNIATVGVGLSLR